MPRLTRFDIRQASRRILLVLGGLALLNVIFYLVWVQPSVREHRRMRDAHQPAFEELNELRESVESDEGFLKEVRQAEADLQRLRDDILATRDERLVDVQAEVARLATEHRTDADKVGYGNELLLDEELDRLAIEVPLEGGYANLRKFLQAVESSDKFLVVERVALARGKEGGALLSLKISMATYFKAPQDVIERKRELGRRARRRS